MIRPTLALTTAVALCAATFGCSGSPGGPTINKPNNAELAPVVSPVVSSDILAREPLANTATVKHILISWKDLADSFGGRLDPLLVTAAMSGFAVHRDGEGFGAGVLRATL